MDGTWSLVSAKKPVGSVVRYLGETIIILTSFPSNTCSMLIRRTITKCVYRIRGCFCFSGPKQMWAYFYGPIAILLTLNIIYLGLTSWKLWHQCRDCNGGKVKALRFKFLLYVKLIFVMGVTWIFEVLSYADGSRNNFW